MITLCMDTSHIFLVLALIKDGKLLGKVQEECWKKQSEEIFPRLIELCNSCSVNVDDIGAVVITKGPGSYTGVRIAMTVAKVFTAMKQLPLYTISSLQLYAGKKECRVVLDARGKRAYTGVLKDGKFVSGPEVTELENISLDDGMDIIGDGHLLGKEDVWPDLCENFLDLADVWEKADNVHTVTPEYLKSSESYMVKKK